MYIDKRAMAPRNEVFTLFFIENGNWTFLQMYEAKIEKISTAVL